MADERNKYQLSEEDVKLYEMPLEELRAYCGSIDTSPVGEKRSDDVQHVINIWFMRSRAQIAEENRAEYYKELRGEPNDFDEYAPY
ncbi:MAG TPA: hypothetical protein VG895_04460 [Patescibacteria group bacterium]|nr:hypothetical protein [Patescibacteria group bacterium]